MSVDKQMPPIPSVPDASEPARVRPSVTLRAVLIGLAGIPLAAWWIIQIEYVRYSDTPTIAALFFHCIAALALMVGANVLLRRLRPKVAFSSAELLTIYSMLVIGSNLCGHDVLQILFTTIVWLYPRASPANHWAEIIEPSVPKSLLPHDGPALKALFIGNSDLYATGYWRAWLVPLGLWTVFVLMLAGTMFCVASILRKQWDNERLSYPLQEVPLAIAAPGEGLFRSRLFWVAALLAAGLQFLNLGHQLWPSVPGIPLAPQYFQFPSPPWNAAGAIPICYYPFAVGMTFLLPTDLAFSCWFFFLFTRLEMVIATAMGFQITDSSFPYVQQQGTGAYLGYAAITLYAARHHLAAVLRQALHGDGEPDAGEPLSYRTAAVGAAVGSLGILGFAMEMGMRPLVAVAYFSLLGLLVVCVTRLRCEVGLPSIELYQRGADDILLRSFGTSTFTKRELTAETLFFFLNRTHRQFPMMHQMGEMRVGKRSRVEMRRFAGALLLATVAGTVCAFWALLHVLYQTGLASAHMRGPAGGAFGSEPWNKLASWLQSPKPPEPGSVLAYGFGFGATCLLAAMRGRFLWWPFHPVGFVVGASFSLMRLWLPLFTSWLLKTLILRYGGLKGYRRALPFFLGLIVGEFTAGFVRTLLDLSFHLYLPPDSGIGGL